VSWSCSCSALVSRLRQIAFVFGIKRVDRPHEMRSADVERGRCGGANLHVYAERIGPVIHRRHILANLSGQRYEDDA
jgi:hypothetical protein